VVYKLRAGNSRRIKLMKDNGALVLVVVLLVGVYLLYKSLANLGSSITGVGSSVEGYISSIGSTLGSEASAIGALPSQAESALGNLGTTIGGYGSSIENWFSSLGGSSDTTGSSYYNFIGSGDSGTNILVPSGVSSSNVYIGSVLQGSILPLVTPPSLINGTSPPSNSATATGDTLGISNSGYYGPLP
jgi:hypothetical protein